MNYTRLNKNTKKAQGIKEVRKYTLLHYGNRYIYNCYVKPSFYKTRAEAAIINEMHRLGGYNYTIQGYNCMMFTCSFEDDSNIYYFTKEHNYIIEK